MSSGGLKYRIDAFIKPYWRYDYILQLDALLLKRAK